MYSKHQTKFFGSAVFAVLLAACGGGGGGGSNPPPTAASNAPTQATIEQTFVLQGRVSDGPLSGADIKIYDSNDVLLDVVTTDDYARYSTELSRSAEFPLRIAASGGTDLVTMRAPSFELVSYAFDGSQSTTNISSQTTLLSRIAACKGELSEQSFDDAWRDVNETVLLGLAYTSNENPLRSDTGAQAIASFVLANEALAEWIRRTVAVLDESISHLQLVEAMACDLVDGRLDGSAPGSIGASELKSVLVARVLDVAIRLEVLYGELHVGGANASDAIDNALLSIQPDAAVRSVVDVPLASDAKGKLVALLDELELVLNTDGLAPIDSAIGNGQTVEDLRSQGFNPQWSMALEELARQVAEADTKTIATLAERLLEPSAVVPNEEIQSAPPVEASDEEQKEDAVSPEPPVEEEPPQEADEGRVPNGAEPVDADQVETQEDSTPEAPAEVEVTENNAASPDESSEENEPEQDVAPEQVVAPDQGKGEGSETDVPNDGGGDSAMVSQDPVSAEDQQQTDTGEIEDADASSDQSTDIDLNLIEGSVGYGLIRDAKVVVYDRNGNLLSQTASDASGKFNLEYPASAAFPLFLEASDGFDEAVQADQSVRLSAFVPSANYSNVQLSRLTTVSSETARCLSDFSSQRWYQIWGRSKKTLAMGFGPYLFDEPMLVPVPPGRSSAFSLSDQVLGELIRRTTNALRNSVAVESVLAVIGCEMADGRINGVLPKATTVEQERILMVAKGVEASLRFELITQNFEVNGVDGYSRVDAALLRAKPETTLLPSRELSLRPDAWQDATNALERVAAMDVNLQSLVAQLKALPDGSLQRVTELVNADNRVRIRELASNVAAASDEVVSRLFRGQGIAAQANDSAAQSGVEEENDAESSEAATNDETGSMSDPAGQSQQDNDETSPSDAPSGNSTGSAPQIPDADPPLVTLVGSSEQIGFGESVQLDWQSSGAESCRAEGGWSGNKGLSGAEVVGPLNESTTFSLSCDGPGGTALVLYAVEVFKTYALSWVPPVENTDGSRVEGLSQFKIYYGTQSRVYDNFIPVDGREKSYRLSLPVGRYYFAVTAVDLDGDESEYSNEVVKE